MNHLSTMYATKRRRRNSKSIRTQPKEGQTKTNPSKRHRERLNAELDLLASLLPFEQNVLSKLDKLSILRLSVSYLRTKSYFNVILAKKNISIINNNCLLNANQLNNNYSHLNQQLTNLQTNERFNSSLQSIDKSQQTNHNSHVQYSQSKSDFDLIESLIDGDEFLEAIDGFLIILTCEGEVFYTSHTVEEYLGFHQSDICHQSVYELVHSEDREELQRQLMWNSSLPNDKINISLNEVLQAKNWQYLERNFTVRFRCLNDNTSGFDRLDIRGRIKILYGQNIRSFNENSFDLNTPLALFAVCTRFGPPPLRFMPCKESLFKSKHRLDFSWIQLDAKGRQLLGFSESDLTNRGGYDLIHFDDLAYVANAHQELLKTGASSLIAYRLCTKNSESWKWLQTYARLVYKNSKPDFILCNHLPLMEEQGRDLFGKRIMDFKVTYLDLELGTLTNTDHNFDCERTNTNEKSLNSLSEGRIKNNTNGHIKTNKIRKFKSEKMQISTTPVSKNSSLLGVNINTAVCTATTSANFLNGTLEQAFSTYANTHNSVPYVTSFTDYYNNTQHSHQNTGAAYYNSSASNLYEVYNGQTNVTIINNNYNLNLTQNNNSNNQNNSNLNQIQIKNQSGDNILSNLIQSNENSSCSSLSSSNSSFSSTLSKKKINSNNMNNENYEQFHHFNHINNNLHNPHSFHTSNNSNQMSLHHSVQHTNNMLLNTTSDSLNSVNNFTCSNSSNRNHFTSLNNDFIYSTSNRHSIPTTTNDSQLLTVSNSNSNSQLQSQLVVLNHDSSSLSNSTTPVLHDTQTTNQKNSQTNIQLSPMSNTHHNPQIQNSINESMNLEISNLCHQTQPIHLNQTNNSCLESLLAQSNSSSPNQANSPSSAAAVALAAAASHYHPYNVANHHHTPHHFLHYSRLSSYYHPEYHLYNYFEPKFKNTGNLISNNLISNDLFSIQS